jgi:hypothetical protein
MKSHDELMALTEEELQWYLDGQVDLLLAGIEDEDHRRATRGLQWKINCLRQTKYKGDPLGLCVELSSMAVSNLGKMNEGLCEITDIITKK